MHSPRWTVTGDMEDRQATHTVDLDNCIVIVKSVPAKVCSQCGEIWYSGTVAKQLEKKLWKLLPPLLLRKLLSSVTPKR